jgi:gas vesicle protein
MKDTSKLIAALLIGAAAGAALGILLAPEKGETVRDGIADFFTDLFDTARQRAQSAGNDLKARGGQAYDKARTKFRGAIDDIIDHKDEAIEAAAAKAKAQ